LPPQAKRQLDHTVCSRGAAANSESTQAETIQSSRAAKGELPQLWQHDAAAELRLCQCVLEYSHAEEVALRLDGRGIDRVGETSVDVVAWLRSLGLEQYQQAFCDNAIDAAVLPELTADDLKDLGVNLVGHRRKLLAAIAALRSDTVPHVPVPAVPTERRQLTVMFCDLVGSTELSSRLDPEDLREVIGAYHAAVAEVIARFGGFVARYMGDGILAYFGYPRAHEDDPERAVRAGLAVAEAVRRLTTVEALRVRVGLATGLAVVGDPIGSGAAQEQAVVGETPNLAARLQALAVADTIVISDNTRRLLGSLFECHDLGELTVKGLSVPVRAYRVVGESGVQSRFEALRSGETPLVGRGEEIALLWRKWAQAKAGSGCVVLISAEPGVGKSRLAEAFRKDLERQPHARLRYFCSPHHQDSALFPVVGQLERAAGFEAGDSPEAKLDKLESSISAIGSGEADLPLLAEMLSLPASGRYPVLDLTPQRKKEKTFEALQRQLAGLARRQPVLEIAEDLHWADPTSHELLTLTVEQVASLPVLLIVTVRPEFQPPWIGQSHVTTLSLRRLSREEGDKLVREIIGNTTTFPTHIVDDIVERTDGVPLFIEELTKAVLERAIEGDRIAAVPSAAPAVPATLHASLTARLDRLGSTAKEVAQIGAAIGRDFTYEMLAATVQRTEAELRDALVRLVDAGLIFQRGTPPLATFLFKHALVQDTAYSMLLRRARRALHTRIADAYEHRVRDVIDVRPEVMAHHLAEAGFAERSIAFWLKAAQIAMARGAAAEAVAQLRRGLSLLGEIPAYDVRQRQEIELQIALGNALMAAAGYTGSATDVAFRRARELCLEAGDTIQLMRVTWGLFTGHFAGGRQRQALAMANELLASSQQLDDAGGRRMGHASVGTCLLHLASFAEARAQLELALAVDSAGEREWTHLYGQSGRVTALSYMSLDILLLGFPMAARRLAEQSVEEAHRLAHPTSLCFAHSIASRVYYLLRDMVALARHSTMVLRLADEHGLGLWRALGTVYAGWSRAENGEADEGAAMIRGGLTRYRAAGAALSLPLYLASLASIQAVARNRKAALEILDEAQAASAAGDEHWISAEISRLAGEMLMAGSADDAGAERKFNAALVMAREQGAKLWELRAATSLARLRRDQGRQADARDVLAPIHGWFTEGFDTPDLKEARVLLKALNP